MNAIQNNDIAQRRVPPLCLWLLVGLGFAFGWTPQAQAANYQGNGANDGPVRMARFSSVSGDVSWRRNSQEDWSSATNNLPIRQGAQVSVSGGGRAEIQFDDGSRLRLGNNALVTLQTLYSDADGEFTEITLNDGPASLRLKQQHSLYQINTPIVSVKATGPARLRVGTGNETQVAVLKGRATIEGPQGKTNLQTGDYLDLRDENSPYDITGLPRPDSFDTWSDARDRRVDAYGRRHARRALPPNIAIVGDDLDDYGTWRNDPRYGEVWAPRVRTAGWRPYSAGHWVWVDPFGWTWVADEPWGWAPYHYGTWINGPDGWAWVPGPRHQYWSPGVVSFTQYDGSVGWCPLAPAEVRYPPALSVGFRGGDWSRFFSIGQAAVYYPTSRNVYVADPWQTRYVNRDVFINNTTVINNTTIVRNVTVNQNTYLPNSGFVPFNARAGGATLADPRTFGGRGNFQLASRQQAINAFSRGRAVAAPVRGQFPVAGPPAVRPTALAMTPTRAFRPNVRISPAVLNRPVYRAPIRPAIASASVTPVRVLPVNVAPRVWTRTNPTARATGGSLSRPNPSTRTVPITKSAPFGANRTPPGTNSPRLTHSIPGQPSKSAPGFGNPKGSAAERAMRARASLGLHSNISRPTTSTPHAPVTQHAPSAPNRTTIYRTPATKRAPTSNRTPTTGRTPKMGQTPTPNRATATGRNLSHPTSVVPANRPHIAPHSGNPNGNPAERARRARADQGAHTSGPAATPRPNSGRTVSSVNRPSSINRPANQGQNTTIPPRHAQVNPIRPPSGNHSAPPSAPSHVYSPPPRRTPTPPHTIYSAPHSTQPAPHRVASPPPATHSSGTHASPANHGGNPHSAGKPSSAPQHGNAPKHAKDKGNPRQ